MMHLQQIILLSLIFLPMVCGVIQYVLFRGKEQARDIWNIIVTGVLFALSLCLLGESHVDTYANICGNGISFVNGGFRTVLAILTAGVWFVTSIFSKSYFENADHKHRYSLFLLLTEGATMGIFLANDFFTLFLFFEMMSFTSFVLVIQEQTEQAIEAAKTYLAVAVIGGLVTLMGLFLLYQKAGTLQMDLLQAFMIQQPKNAAYYIMGGLVFFGFGAKAGIVPLHIWLPAAYTEAPAPATTILSCILTKTGVVGAMAITANLFLHDHIWGYLMLGLGVVTMLWGGVLAVFSVNLKRTLACSSMSQIGFLMVGIGMQGLLGEHNALAASGTILHFLNHSFLKLVLFTVAGIIYLQTKELDLNRIKGYGRNNLFLKVVFLIALLGIGGIPLGNGYISKTLLHESIVEYMHLLQEAGQPIFWIQCVEWAFLFAGGLTLAYMTKLFVAVFVEQGSHTLQDTMPKYEKIVLGACALLLPVLGMFPYATQERFAEMSVSFVSAHMPEHTIHYFAYVNLKGALLSVLIGAVVYMVFVRKCLMKKNQQGETIYLDCFPKWLNLENNVYRPLLLKILPFIGGLFAKTCVNLIDASRLMKIFIFIGGLFAKTCVNLVDGSRLLKIFIFIGALFARMCANLVDGLVALLRMLIFNVDNAKFIPKEDKYFSAYTDGEVDKTVYREGFARSLMMIGIGLAVAMLYILL